MAEASPALFSQWSAKDAPTASVRAEPDALVFQSQRGTPLSDTNLLDRHPKAAGRRLGLPWLNWHTLRRTHASLLQQAGGSLREAQAQLGHARMSATLEIYTIPLAAAQRQAVEKLSVLVTNSDEKAKTAERFPPQTLSIQ